MHHTRAWAGQPAPIPHARRFTHLLNGQIYVRASGSGDDEAIARVAACQHGNIARRQLRALAIGIGSIQHRQRCGRLRRVHAGVYAVGHGALSLQGRIAAAILAMGNGAVASHATAGALWEIGDFALDPIHVTVPQARRPQPGMAIHRGTPPPDEVEFVDGLPVTGVARTLLDLSGCEPPQRVRRLVKNAEFKKLTDGRRLELILQRYPRRQGRRSLAALARSKHLESGISRSDLEDLFLEFLVRRKLPMPERNAVLEVDGYRFEADCVWREARLIVELDGRDGHQTDSAFQDDRKRDRVLLAAGWETVRVTTEQLKLEAGELERDIRTILRRTSR